MLGKIQNAKITETVKTAKTNEVKTEQNQQEIKDGKKKLALALGALGVAGAGIVIAAKSGKLSSLKKVKSATTNAKEEIKEVVLKKPKRFTPTSSSYITKTGTDGKTKTFLKEVGTISNPNFRNGETIKISKLTDLTTGEISSVKELKDEVIKEVTEAGTLKLGSKNLTYDSMICRIAGPNSGPIKLGRIVLPNGEKTIATYSADEVHILGKNYIKKEIHNNLRSIMDSSFDKKTGILTQTEKFCRKSEKGINYNGFSRTYLTNPKTGNTICFDSDAFSPENIFANIEIGNTKGISDVNLGYHGSNIFEDLKNALTRTKNPITSDTALLDELKKYMK